MLSFSKHRLPIPTYLCTQVNQLSKHLENVSCRRSKKRQNSSKASSAVPIANFRPRSNFYCVTLVPPKLSLCPQFQQLCEPVCYLGEKECHGAAPWALAIHLSEGLGQINFTITFTSICSSGITATAPLRRKETTIIFLLTLRPRTTFLGKSSF